MGQYSTTDAAKKLGMNARTIKRLCLRMKLGEMVGGVRILSDDDLAKLAPLKGREAGNPDWIALRKPDEPTVKRGKKAKRKR